MISRDSVQDIWGPRTPFFGEWPERTDERTLEDPDTWVQSACVLCSNGCALDIGVKDGRIVGVRGRGMDRVNRGRLGPKGLHGWIANGSESRLKDPQVRSGGKLKTASWDEALDLIARRVQEVKAKHGPGALGFYTTGQLFLEEYYTLAAIVRAGLGTNHLDGNTRLCTSTAAMALIESFGSDGDPGSYGDFDVTDSVFLVGHNMAETQTVLWSRLLDRRAGPRPPKLIVVDPRKTPTAKEADVHLAPRMGTNVALLNGLIRLVIQEGQLDRGFIEEHTSGFDLLRDRTGSYTPEQVARLTGVPAADLRRAGAVLGNAPSLVSTCLQGVYQSMQATAAAVQVNNLHLIRGMIGKPGCTVFQMNGQPTAQNTRECGADGELAAFLNWANPAHVARFAAHLNVAPDSIPHYAPPTHIMGMMRYAEEGSLRFLWVIGTNPAVSLPDLARVRQILRMKSLFLVVSDAFPTETTALADVVLPAALWGEKTGVFTNADRTAHISHLAVNPPGRARSDFEILLDFARRMDLRDAQGAPLIKWSRPEAAFDHFKELTRGRPCDYSGMTYAKLTGGSGVQWPCNEKSPGGCERLYADGIFPTSADDCELYGHDIVTGAAIPEEEYRAADPKGRARIKPADYEPPAEAPDSRYPFFLTTGRRVYHFHTRTKTGRAKELAAAAPDAWIEMALEDARRLGLEEGDRAELESRRGRAQGRVRLGGIAPGQLFMPFHYGYWDRCEEPRAANELTLSAWDPVSKQPYFKYAAVRIRKVSKP